jgi:serine/threonine-protein kinase
MTEEPAEIGRYRIETVLGRGAMGVIYLAHDPDIDRKVAIKLVRADLLSGEDRADYLARFRREAQAAGRCSHPNIVTIYDFALHEGNPFLAMEYVDGVSLSQARQRGTVFSPQDAGFVMAQVLDGLAAAHAMGIVHRDIKPANILLVGGNRVKVTDFGISRFNTSEMTQDGSVVGTPSYMSPEQCRGDAVDSRSDLFSTAAVLYELLCGERPFPGKTIAEVMQRLLNEAPADLRARNPAVVPALAAVVERALAKRAPDRFATAGEMAAALRAALGAGAAGNGGDDRTVFVPPAAAAAMAPEVAPHPADPGLSGIFDVDSLATLERRLARYVGPIAHYLVQSAVRKSGSVETLCETLAGNIAQAQERDVFRQEALRQLRGVAAHATTTAAPAAVGPDEQERAQQALTEYLGPVARVMVKRAAAAATSPADLWQRLSAHIESQADRAAFLARRGKRL